MANTTIKLSSGDTYRLDMSGEQLRAAVSGADALVKLPVSRRSSIYINPAHIVCARESTGAPGAEEHAGEDGEPLGSWR